MTEEFECPCGVKFKRSKKALRNNLHPMLCRKCAQRECAKLRYAVHLFDFSTLVILREEFRCVDATGLSLPQKSKFNVNCKACNVIYETTLQNEKLKIHAWHCQSCAISNEWKKVEYRDVRAASISLASSQPEAKLQRSIRSKENWKDPEFRRRVFDRDNKALATKARATIRFNIENGIRTYKTGHGKRTQIDGLWVKSSYESRFVKWLKLRELLFEYEPKWFPLLSGKYYVPDFFVPKLNLWIEVKGWWRNDALEKFEHFLAEQSGTKIALVTRRELEKLESGEIEIEACIVKTGWQTTRI